MTEPVGSARGPSGPRRVKARRTAEGAQGPQAAGAASRASAADAAPDAAPVDPAQAVSVQVMGQGPADSAPANFAHKAQKAYLAVEWSGGADRRTRRGRIAKADI